MIALGILVIVLFVVLTPVAANHGGFGVHPAYRTPKQNYVGWGHFAMLFLGMGMIALGGLLLIFD